MEEIHGLYSNTKRNSMKSSLRRLASAGTLGLTLAHSSQGATILTGSDGADNVPLPANHGSNVTGTPDLTLTWTTVGGGSWQSYNGWPNAGAGGQAYQADGPGAGYPGTISYNIAFSPSSALIAVALTSIALNDWVGGTGNGGNTTVSWSVMGSVSGALGSGSGLVVTDGTVQTLNLGAQGVGGETLTFSLTPTAGSGSYFAVDNISFDQVTVPEPSSALLAGAGLGALALRRRRK